MIDLVTLRKSFGAGTQEEIVAGCQAVCPSIEDYPQAERYLWAIIRKLLDSNRYRAAAHMLWGPDLFDPKPQSVARLLAAVENNAKIIVLGGGAQGKCLKKGTKIVMADGRLARVEDVCVGDKLAGPSGPKLVTNRHDGREEMFEITPYRGDPFVCTKDHILSLKCTEAKLCGNGKVSSVYTKGNVIDIRLDDYLKKSRTFKEHFKLFRSGWDIPSHPVIFDPYIYGCWLGDGTVGCPDLTNEAPKVIERWCSYFTSLGYRIKEHRKEGTGCKQYFARTEIGKENPFTDFVRSSYIDGEKRILRSYLQNSKNVRMAILAGLLDTDGHTGGSNATGFEITTKYAGLADDIRYLAHSLGFYVSRRKERKGILSIGFSAEYWRIRIGGPCHLIPTIHRRAKPPKWQDSTCSSFKVRSLGTEEYAGFTLNGDHRFILESGWVTHNSYSIIAWLMLDWLRDPQYTGARIISTTSSHALGNTFSSLQRFYDESIVPLPGFSQHGFIGLDPKDRHASLSIIAIKQGENGKNSLQGFHPVRRPEKHPVFGYLSRIRLFLDEAELIPGGVWRGVGNLLSNLQGKDNVKAICATNPWDVTSILAQNGEPKLGWSKVDVDRDKEWISKLGWKTIRLDPADSENVKERKEVFPGLMTFQGYEEYRSKTGGEDPEYLCFARSMYPTQGAIDQIIPLSYLDDFYGEWIFEAGTAVGCGAVDLAFEGDDCIFFAGRYGKALAFHPHNSDIIKLEEPRYVVQLDQFRTLQKLRTEAQYDNIKKVAGEFGISFDWLCLDKTGVGRGVADLFWEHGYTGILAQGWGQKSTHTKVLDEDRCFADEVYDGVAAEMFFAFRDFLEFGFIKCSPNIDMTKLKPEIIGRKRKRSGLGPTGEQMYGLETKLEFKKRYPHSPDRADALIMLLHVARIRGPEKAQMSRKKKVIATGTYDSLPDNISYIDFSSEN